MRKAGWQTPAELRALRLQAPGAGGGGELPRPLKPSSPPRCPPPRPGTPIPPPRSEPQPAPQLAPCTPASAARDQGRQQGAAGPGGRGSGAASREGRRPWAERPPRSPHRRGHASAALTRTTPPGATRPRSVAACASSALSRSAGEGLLAGRLHQQAAETAGGPGSAGERCERAGGKMRLRPGIGSERLGRWGLGRGSGPLRAAQSGGAGGSGHTSGAGWHRGRGRCATRRLSPPTCSGAPLP